MIWHIHAVTRIRTWVIAATTQGTNHYTITAKLRTFWDGHVSSFQYMQWQMNLFLNFSPQLGRYHAAVVAEWLRRLTRNQIPSGSVGSNPTDCARFYSIFSYVPPEKGSRFLENSHLAVVAEWLRRLTRNQIPSGSVGSSPTNCDEYFVFQ